MSTQLDLGAFTATLVKGIDPKTGKETGKQSWQYTPNEIVNKKPDSGILKEKPEFFVIEDVERFALNRYKKQINECVIDIAKYLKSLTEEEQIYKAEEYFEKGGKEAFIGEIRTFGGREYIKTIEGWKFHGKGTGKKAQEHKHNASHSSTLITNDIITQALHNAVKEGYYKKEEVQNLTPEQINNGLCDFVAEEAKRKIKGVKYESTDELSIEDLENYKFTTHGHSWVSLNGKHYDAEAPQGVNDWKDLPFFKRSFQLVEKEKRESIFDAIKQNIYSLNIDELGVFAHQAISGASKYFKDDSKKRNEVHQRQLDIYDAIGKFYKKNGGLNKTLEKYKDSVEEINYNELTPLQETISPQKVSKKLEDKDTNKYLPVVFQYNGEKILEGGTHRTTASLLSGEKKGKFIFINLDAENSEKKLEEKLPEAKKEVPLEQETQTKTSSMKQVIGFTNHYFTLWHKSAPYRHFFNEYDFEWRTDFTYIQNLSKDFETAKSKVEGEYEVDKELRGLSSFTRGTGSGEDQMFSTRPMEQFSFGKLKGMDMRACDDVWQLTRAMRQEKQARRRVIARRRLIELGELIRYPHFQEVLTEVRDESGDFLRFDRSKIKANYADQEYINKQQIKEANGHFWKNGEKITTKIKLIETFSFETAFGRTYVDVYLTEDGKVVKYMGSNPPDNVSKEKFVSVKATVKHDNYKGVDETKLQRIKII